MNVLIITRLFSGLLNSMKTEEWHPNGIPAIYKLIEALDKKKVSMDVLFLCKTEKQGRHFKGVTNVRFKGIHANFYVLPYYSLPVRSSKLRQLYNDARQFNKVIFSFLQKNKVDLAYFDRANIVLAAIFSLLGVKTVVRFFGIANFNRFSSEFVEDRVKAILYSPLVYLSLKIPHKLLICSEDGSPAKCFLETIPSKKTPYKVLLNGVDSQAGMTETTLSIRKKYDFNNNYPIILFAGRLEPGKGAMEFVDALIQLKKKTDNFNSIIISGGSDTKPLYQKLCSNCSGHNIVFEKFVKHDEIYSFYNQSDIYVSLNKLGNLSNTVLEAMAAGKCIIMLDRDEKSGTDESTEKLIPADSAIKIDRGNIIKDLTLKLLELIENPTKIRQYSERMRPFAKEFLWSWDQRIDYEIQLLEKIHKREPIQ